MTCAQFYERKIGKSEGGRKIIQIRRNQATAVNNERLSFHGMPQRKIIE
jgi:hypothetical protein